jgi:hypothetical protein
MKIPNQYPRHAALIIDEIKRALPLRDEKSGARIY